MKLTVLLENTALRPELHAAHGLSLYVETGDHKLLFDLGPKAQFLENAQLLGVDIGQVDTVVLSHGHYDHGGGLEAFLKHNARAIVYVARGAFDAHFTKVPKYADIGLAPRLAYHAQVRTVPAEYRIDPGLLLFSDVPGDELVPPTNEGLMDRQRPDQFAHEQSLLLEDHGIQVLFGGCAHRGIVNILEESRRLTGRYPDVVISGFHLMSPGTGRVVDDRYLDALAKRLLETKAMFYTCHCTGPEAFKKLKERMGSSVAGISTGSALAFGG